MTAWAFVTPQALALRRRATERRRHSRSPSSTHRDHLITPSPDTDTAMLVCAFLLVPAPAARCHQPRCTSESGDSLTLEALRTRLRDTWRSLCEGADQGAIRGVSVGEWASRSLLTTRLDGLALDRVHLAKSGIEGAGDGLFASRDLQAGSLVTLYPGDALRVWGGRDEDEDSWWGAPPASL